MKIKPLPSQKRICELLSYDPDTGIFRHLPNPAYRPCWNARHVGKPAGMKLKKGIEIYVDHVRYSAHRLAWVYVHGDVLDTETQIDHRNCDQYDNRIENLRPATHPQNIANQRRQRRATLPKGVARNHKRFLAQIRVNGQQIYLGTFDTPQEAHEAYAVAARHHFGNFARTA